MTRRMRRVSLALTVIVALSVLALFLATDAAREPVRPDDAEELARWVAQHPSDWLAASALADAALDSSLPNRVPLWQASFAHARTLAPMRTNAAAGFVRAGLFHWYELGPEDRRRVLAVAAPLLGNPRTFAQLHVPLWRLTRDFAYLRRVAPRTIGALESMRELAVLHGLMAEYRDLRETLRRERLRELARRRAEEANPADLLDLIPVQLDAADEPLVQGILEELDLKTFVPDQITGRIDALAQLAVDHDIQPLRGLTPLLEHNGALREVTRARVALRIDKPDLATRIELTTAVTGEPEWVRYQLDRARYEARKGDAGAANAQLAQASIAGVTTELLAATAEVADILGNARAGAAAREQLASRPARKWSGTCGQDVCATATAIDYVARAGEPLSLTLTTMQSDETPPYVEIYANDVLVAEGEVRDVRRFELQLGAGLQRLEVRLVNRFTRNGVQRRVRLS